jgi:hypothetical protein
MASYFEMAVAAGLAIATVNGYFVWKDHDAARALRTFLGWTLAFVAAGLLARPVSVWLLTHVF